MVQGQLLEIFASKSAKEINSKRHLIDVDNFSPDEIKTIMQTAKLCLQWMDGKHAPMTMFAANIVGNLFFENSTRTRSSFELAATNLGARVLNLDIDKSSVAKGETLEDTAYTLISMGVNAIVIRHSQDKIQSALSKILPDDVSVLNAGDGVTAHPTQALLDFFTMSQIACDLTDKRIVIVGDIKHSRVARSNILLLKKMGAKVEACGPTKLMPGADELKKMGVTVQEDLNTAIADADFIMALRIQKERLQSDMQLSFEDFQKKYQINHTRLEQAKSKAKILHPGPVNRGVELTDELADDAKLSLIRTQVRNGVAVRMAMMALLFSRRPC